MAKRQNINVEVLRQLLDYDWSTGALTWRVRPAEFFKTEHRMKIWNARYAGKPAFTCVNGSGYHCGAVLGCGLLAHPVIWAIITGAWSQLDLDHIDGDKRNNRFENLREVTREINARNAKRYSHNTSGHSGVSWCAAAGKWRARVTVDGELIHLGVFADIDAAVAARKSAETAHGFTERHGT